MTSTIIFGSNPERFCRKKAHTVRLCTYQSTKKLDNFQGFRRCLYAVFRFPVVSSWRKFRHKVLAACLLSSSSNRITNAFAVKGHTQFAFVRINRFGRDIISKFFVRVWLPCLGSPLLVFLCAKLETKFWPYACYHHLRIE